MKWITPVVASAAVALLLAAGPTTAPTTAPGPTAAPVATVEPVALRVDYPSTSADLAPLFGGHAAKLQTAVSVSDGRIIEVAGRILSVTDQAGVDLQHAGIGGEVIDAVASEFGGVLKTAGHGRHTTFDLDVPIPAGTSAVVVRAALRVAVGLAQAERPVGTVRIADGQTFDVEGGQCRIKQVNVDGGTRTFYVVSDHKLPRVAALTFRTLDGKAVEQRGFMSMGNVAAGGGTMQFYAFPAEFDQLVVTSAVWTDVRWVDVARTVRFAVGSSATDGLKRTGDPGEPEPAAPTGGRVMGAGIEVGRAVDWATDATLDQGLRLKFVTGVVTGQIVLVDRDRSRLDALTDSTGADLTPPIGPWPRASLGGATQLMRDDRHCSATVLAGRTPTPGAAWVRARGTLMLSVADGRVERPIDLKLTNGATFKVGENEFKVEHVGRDAKDGNWPVSFRFSLPVRGVDETAFTFVGDDGKPIAAKWGGTWTPTDGTGQSREYDLARRVDHVKVLVPVYTGLHDVAVPFDLRFGFSEPLSDEPR